MCVCVCVGVCGVCDVCDVCVCVCGVCVQVWVSPDGDQWTTILDYSRLKCYSTQRLFFSKMAIRSE